MIWTVHGDTNKDRYLNEEGSEYIIKTGIGIKSCMLCKMDLWKQEQQFAFHKYVLEYKNRKERFKEKPCK